MNDDIPSECESVHCDEKPTNYIRWMCPNETVYYCQKHWADKRKMKGAYAEGWI